MTADALPTWQINGVVWSQAIVGNTVYVTGSFTKARPPGVAVGGVGEVDALNIFAYDITTGNRVASFDHALNAQGLALTRSPDGSRIYVAGDFTTVDGVAHGHIAAFAADTGALLPWAANIGGQVRAVAATSDTVYAGGGFPSAGGQARDQLAAYSATKPLLLPWAPSAQGVNPSVAALLVTPDQRRVVLAGSFEQINGIPALGMGAVDAVTGEVGRWDANQKIRSGGNNGGITSLSTDGTQIFGSGYAFGAGAAFEGTFAAEPTTGSINWINDCLGDNYSTYAVNHVLYSVGHSHDCSVVGSFPDTSPRARWQKATAAPTYPTGTIGVKDAYGWDFRGYRYAGILHWFPDFKFGTYTSAGQAAWSVAGAGDYVTYGGEFPTVNGKAQQGLVRFAMPSIAPKGMKPIYSPSMDPVATSTEAGRVKVDFGTMWDRDDATLTYEVYRDGGPAIGALTAASNFWTLPGLTFTDAASAPGTTHSYKIRAKDKDGNVQWSLASAPVTVSSSSPSPFLGALRSDSPSHVWRLGDAGPTINDAVGGGNGTSTGITFGSVGAVTDDSAISSPGGATSKLWTSFNEAHPGEVTVQAWMKTTSVAGGRIIGFGNSQTGTSAATTNDLVLYVNSANKLAFAQTGIGGAVRAVASNRTVNDGQWHLVSATAGSSGISLFVDGRRVGRDQAPVVMTGFTGYWRLLADQTTGLPNRPTNAGLAGSFDEVTVFPTELSQAQIQAQYVASNRAANWSSAPADPYGQSVVADGPDLYWRLGESLGASTAVDASASGQDGAYVGGVTLGVAGSPATGPGRAATFNGTNGLLVDKETATAPKFYSTEAWFRTSTTKGGKLIGFGNAATGLSSSYDRQVVMLSNGHLQFGTNGAVRTTLESAAAYNNGQWHHVVATQGAAGMALYVDGSRVASNSISDAQNFVGWWRVGGDRTFGGTTSNYLAADLDEVAVYPSALTSAQVRAHFEAAGGTVLNQAPIASWTSSSSFLALSVDGSRSIDTDGAITSYSWNWGDATPDGVGATATHTYAAAGTYSVILTVVDDRGGSSTSSQAVTVSVRPNDPPVASFTHSEVFLQTSVDGGGSNDPDGTIASYTWNWGDGTPDGSGATASHAYAAAGTFTVALTVTDDKGTASTRTASVTVAANVAPTASFTDREVFLALSVDGTASSDPDGSVLSYAWNWGDGTGGGTGSSATHSYSTAGTYPVTLTVTDDQGGTATITRSVTVQAAPNQAPVAALTHTENGLTTSVSGTGSTDADGSLMTYSWSWGDGTIAGTGSTATHTYATTGAYTVTLTVTDDGGATGATTATVVVGAVLASDTFERTLVTGWGTAEAGGAWTLNGLAGRWSVSNGAGRLSLNAADGYTATLSGVSSSKADVSATLTTDKVPTGGGQYASVIGRRTGSTDSYRAKVRFAANGDVSLWLARNQGATETILATQATSGFTYAAGDRVVVRLQVTGTSPSTIRARVWKLGSPEPTTWLTTTDSTASMQVSGSAGVYLYLSGSTVNAPVVYGIDNYTVTELP
ncbi:hypothetical protein ASC58_14135 [Phycicoccus sp. Root101]|nr:hypothetical protein ASC58_14135 [Phycicoccus sp. Root101]